MGKALRVAKWIGIGLVALIILIVVVVYGVSQYHLSQSHSPESQNQFSAADGDPVEGKRLAAIYGCSGCHDQNLQGGAFVDELAIGKIYSSNLTRALESYTDSQFDHAVRQGIRKDGSGLIIMPSQSFAALNDKEMADIIAFLRSVPAEGEVHPLPSLGPVVRFFVAIEEFGTAPEMVERAKHNMPFKVQGHEAGRRLAFTACSECHGNNLAGDELGDTPDLVIAASYSLKDFEHLMRTGEGAGGRDLGLMSRMGRSRFKHFSDEEIETLHGYLVARAEARLR